MTRMLSLGKVLLVLHTGSLAHAARFVHTPQSGEASYSLEIPASWEKEARKIKNGTIVKFTSPAQKSRVFIEIRSETLSANAAENQLAATMAKLGAAYETVYHVRTFAVSENAASSGNEVMVWRARNGTAESEIYTTVLKSEKHLIRITCAAPVALMRTYKPIFMNTIHSAGFTQEAPVAETEAAENTGEAVDAQ